MSEGSRIASRVTFTDLRAGRADPCVADSTTLDTAPTRSSASRAFVVAPRAVCQWTDLGGTGSHAQGAVPASLSSLVVALTSLQRDAYGDSNLVSRFRCAARAVVSCG